ncbi:hypothetical protein BDV96DRAFT_599691 [Lophiotrema nucula]|uniref:Uncharacterized protein n=1 Tax=Lophiotrema nucula TaxID=690887 RepID=A0A6A5Z9B8_9PLEO|nr:hypothetical protein BDV96DRAFT_599691 [Lophiotrema nucula]
MVDDSHGNLKEQGRGMDKIIHARTGLRLRRSSCVLPSDAARHGHVYAHTLPVLWGHTKKFTTKEVKERVNAWQCRRDLCSLFLSTAYEPPWPQISTADTPPHLRPPHLGYAGQNAIRSSSSASPGLGHPTFRAHLLHLSGESLCIAPVFNKKIILVGANAIVEDNQDKYGSSFSSTLSSLWARRGRLVHNCFLNSPLDWRHLRSSGWHTPCCNQRTTTWTFGTFFLTQHRLLPTSLHSTVKTVTSIFSTS